MKNLIIVFMLSFILLTTGCGLWMYNLNQFTLPDDTEFLTLIEELDTPKKICQYMLDNFEAEEHPYIPLTPYQLYITRKGDCSDFTTFAMFIAHYHGYETYQILMLFPKPIYPIDTWHAIPVFKEDNYYTCAENQYYNPFGRYYNSFYDIVQEYNGWVKYKVYDYDMQIIEQFTLP